MCASTAGKRAKLHRTERREGTLSDYDAEMIRLDQGQSEHVNLLFYGHPNAGTTVLRATIHETTFWLVCEPGIKAAVRSRAKRGEPPHKGARRISDSATAWAAVEWLESRSNKVGARKPRYEQLDWIVLD